MRTYSLGCGGDCSTEEPRGFQVYEDTVIYSGVFITILVQHCKFKTPGLVRVARLECSCHGRCRTSLLVSSPSVLEPRETPSLFSYRNTPGGHRKTVARVGSRTSGRFRKYGWVSGNLPYPLTPATIVLYGAYSRDTTEHTHAKIIFLRAVLHSP